VRTHKLPRRGQHLRCRIPLLAHRVVQADRPAAALAKSGTERQKPGLQAGLFLFFFVSRTRCSTLSAFTRVFDALWCCFAEPGPTQQLT
jgi:hypothetical protein